jgi:hypothetical protein
VLVQTNLATVNLHRAEPLDKELLHFAVSEELGWRRSGQLWR